MTTSLLRRIWQRFNAEPAAAPPKQRLTGFEPLEPRMVLSGFVAYSTPDYFLGPPGDFSHIDRSGAEIARPMTTYGYSEYNVIGRGFDEAAPHYQLPSDEIFMVYNLNFSGLRLSNSPEVDLRFGTGWNSGSASLGGTPSNSNPAPGSLAADTAEGEAQFEGSPISEAPDPALPPPSNSPTYPGSSSLAGAPADERLADFRPLMSNGSQPNAPPPTFSLTTNGSFDNRDSSPYGARPELPRYERDAAEHDAPMVAHAGTSDASLALTVRASSSSIDRGMVGSTAAALSGQAGASGDSIGVPTTDGSTATGKVGSQTTDSSVREQVSLTELTDAERLNMKRKLAAGTATLEEAARSNNGLGDQFDVSDAQLAYDATRPFDVTAIPAGQIRQLAAANLTDDGLIEVLAADVTTAVASGNAVGQAGANRQIAMEPAVATYQAFETIVAGDSQAGDVAADAAQLATAVAMNAQPVVQAE
jgi:hypothetical protein